MGLKVMLYQVVGEKQKKGKQQKHNGSALRKLSFIHLEQAMPIILTEITLSFFFFSF